MEERLKLTIPDEVLIRIRRKVRTRRRSSAMRAITILACAMEIRLKGRKLPDIAEEVIARCDVQIPPALNKKDRLLAFLDWLCPSLKVAPKTNDWNAKRFDADHIKLVVPVAPVPFYESEEWRKVRYQALKLHGGMCQCCGARPGPNRPLHVDHIKPRSKYPELELTLSNLQVLCKDCNFGKGAWDRTDWRPSNGASDAG